MSILGEENAKNLLKNGRKIVYPSNSTIKAYFASFSNDPIHWTKKDDIESREFTLALQALKRGEYEECSEQCVKEINLNGPNKLKAHLLLGSLQFLSGQLIEAIQQFSKIIGGEDVSVEWKTIGYVRRALIYMHQKEFSRALDDLTIGQSTYNRDTDVLQQRAVIYVQQDRIVDAMSEMDRVLEAQPGLVLAQVQQAYFNYRWAVSTENPVKVYSAIQAMQRLYEAHPSNTECASLLAQVLTEQQQYDKAEPILDKSIRDDKLNATAHVHLGLLHLQWNGDIDKAIKLIETAIAQDPKCELAYETLGTIQVQRGRLDDAIRLFNDALNLCRTEVELVHVFSLRDAAQAQRDVAARMNLNLEHLAQMTFGG